MSAVAAMLLACVGLVAPAADATAPAADGSPANGMLAFFSWGSSAGHISDALDLMVVNPDGSNPQTLVTDAVERSLCGFGLTWSPDGNQIAYVSNDGLWIVGADGSNNRKIAQVCASEIDWSPTGEWLALTVPQGDGGVLLVHPDGTGSRFISTCHGGGSHATFSPDGDTIALAGVDPCGAEKWGIFVYDVATGEYVRSAATTQGRGTGTDYTASDLAWSPDGSTILTWFQDRIDAGSCHALGRTGQYWTSDLWTVAVTGSSPLVRVGSTTGEYDWKEWDPTWSPDGQKFAYAATRNTGCTTSATYVPLGYESLWIMNTDGGERQEIYIPPPGALTAVIDVDWQPCTTATTLCHLEPPVDPGGGGPGGGGPGGGGPGRLTSVVPARLLESREGESTVDGLFEGIGRRGAGSVTELPVAGRGGVPGDAAAVMLNVAAVFPDAPGYLVVYPCGSPRPVASNVNYGPGDVVPNAVLAKVGVDGKVCIYTLAGTDIIADVNGYVPNGGSPDSVVPARLLESREGESTVDGLFEGIGRRGAGSVTELPVAGRGGVPGDAAAVMLNVAAVFPDAPGYLVVYPCGSPRPVASNVNYGPGDVVPNAVLAKVGVDGKVCIYTLAGTDIIADVNGYVG